MNAQELYLDSVSGRFMDGVSSKPIENPTFFSNEKRYVKCNVLKVRGNDAAPRQRSKDTAYFMRIGTATTKLADGIDPTTEPPELITAQAVVITASPIAARGSASVITYSPITATFSASISTISRVTADVKCKISYIPPVTALIGATISTATFSTQTFKKTIRTTSIVPGPQVLGNPAVGNFYFTPSVLTFTPVFDKPIQAQFSVSLNTTGGLKAVTVTCKGSSYPAGKYYLDVQSATTPSTAVSLSVIADTSGKISFVKFEDNGGNERGEGYTAPVTISLFKPEAKIIGVKTSESCSQLTKQQSIGYRPIASSGFTTSAGAKAVDSTLTFKWTLGQTSTTPAKAEIIFTEPDATSTTVAISAPRAEIEFVRNEFTSGQYYGVWKINWLADGYGYDTIPTATHNVVTVSNCKIARAYSRTTPARGFTNITKETRNGFTETTQQPLIPAKVITFNSYGNEISEDEVKEINNSISTPNYPGKIIRTAPMPTISSPNREYDAASVSVKYIDARFGATMNQGGLGIILYEFDPVGELIQKEFAKPEGKNIYSTNTAMQRAFENQLDSWEKADVQEWLDALNSIKSIENQFENRIEYLTVNAENLPDEGRQLLAVLTTPPLNPERQISNDLDYVPDLPGDFIQPSQNFASLFKRGIRLVQKTFNGNFAATNYFSSGGVWDAEFSIIDFGQGYSSLPEGISRLDIPGRAITDTLRSFNILKGLETNSIFNSSMTIGITIPTGTSFKKTILSKEAETGKKLSNNAIQHFISDPGFGYTEDVVVDVVITAPTTSGIVTSVTLTNTPAAYIDGIYDCNVQSPPTGTPAKIKIVFDSAKKINGNLFIENSGMGYTSAPIITAPTPNLSINGFLSSIELVNNPSGYFYNTKEYSLSVASSPQTGGNASAKLRIFKTRKITTSFSLNPSADKKYQTPIYTRDSLFNQFETYNLDSLALRKSNFPLRLVLDKAGGGEIQSFFESNNQPDSNSRIFSAKTVYYGKWKNAKVRLLLGTEGTGYVPAAIYNKDFATDMSGVVRNILIEGEEKNIPTYDELSRGFVFSIYADFIVKIEEIEYGNVSISERGFGYPTPPVITAPSPDSDEYGRILGIFSTNNPVGYVPNYIYNLSISSSPSAGGDALGQFTIQKGGAVSAIILNQGFGYLTAPIITAQPPNAVQGYLSNIVVTSVGTGYAPGEYDCSITTAPAGGETASARFIVNQNNTSQFIISNSGNGYVTAPTITAATPGGSVVSGISMTCQGSYYDNDDAKFVLSDSSGDGCVLGSPVISAGKILSVPVINGGYNYLNPAIRFDAPQPPILTPLELSEVEGEFNITTASANQILGSLDARPINLEVYETDGASQQVVARGQVNLLRRIPS